MLNGYELMASDADCVLTMLKVSSGDIGEDELSKWIELNLEALEQ